MLQNDEFFVQKNIIEAGGLSEIPEAIGLIQKYLDTTYSYESKNVRLSQWHPDEGELYELVLAVFTAVLTEHSLTYQAICGLMAGRLPMDDPLDRVKTIAEVIALISQTGLIKINRTGSGNYIMISTEYDIENIPDLDFHAILMEQPPVFTENRHEEFGSFILGGRINYHTGNICLDHLNRMNSIQLKLNKPFLRKYEEAPTFTFTDKDGNYDPDKEHQWELFIANSYRSYIKLVRAGNRFHLLHRYDKRGRCYAAGYHINTQGSSFKKAIVQLANAEVVEM
jgi:hypothetical protein